MAALKRKTASVGGYGGCMEDANRLWGLSPAYVGWLGALAVLAIWNYLRGRK